MAWAKLVVVVVVDNVVGVVIVVVIAFPFFENIKMSILITLGS